MKSIVQWTSLIILSAGLAAGCTSRSRSIQGSPEAGGGPQTQEGVSVTPHPAGTPSSGVQAGQGNQGSQLGTRNEASTAVQFHEKSLQHTYSIDTDNLQYKFTYLSKEESGELAFQDGKATRSFSGLKVGQSGTLTLELLEGANVKLRGVKENLTLNAGSDNKIDLVMRKVGDSTDLVLDVTLEDSAADGDVPDVDVPNEDADDEAGANNTTPSDPLSDWDGKSNVGNDEWKIVPVDG